MLDFDSMQRKRNLNTLICTDHHVKTEQIEVFFRDLEKHLIQAITQADCIIGAIAWLTNSAVLDALSQKKVLLVVQKEDFLRPDLASTITPTRILHLRKTYDLCQAIDQERWRIGPFSQGIKPPFQEAIRCFGINAQNKRFCSPKMHNKFFVFCKKEAGIICPYAVWTGSYNATSLSNYSLENAMIVHSREIACAYAAEAQMIYLQSEPLDWSSRWIAPIEPKGDSHDT